MKPCDKTHLFPAIQWLECVQFAGALVGYAASHRRAADGHKPILYSTAPSRDSEVCICAELSDTPPQPTCGSERQKADTGRRAELRRTARATRVCVAMRAPPSVYARGSTVHSASGGRDACVATAELGGGDGVSSHRHPHRGVRTRWQEHLEGVGQHPRGDARYTQQSVRKTSSTETR